ncbi:MAG: hypothetical protein KF819_20450 [Labilithrix sp.]|nr:hypothetical protein [Labilithrix sp.]
MGRRRPGRCLPRALLAALPILTLGLVDCYSTGSGAEPPLDRFYFPVGLQVSHGGTVLYAINSDFDLQYNGGTLQSYDLSLIRRHTLRLIADPRDPNVPVIQPNPDVPIPLGEIAAPPVDSTFYFRDSAVVGAFATDLVLSRPPSKLVPSTPRLPGENITVGTRSFDRLFAPIRGDASLTWASVMRDHPDFGPTADPKAYGPFKIFCGQDPVTHRCDAGHAAGKPSDPGNSRGVTMPGEPFAMAISEDGESIIVTHQNETKTSLFSTGQTILQADPTEPNAPIEDVAPPPSIQFILDGVPFGGVGATAIPHDRDAFRESPAGFPKPGFFQTSRAIPEVALIRAYSDAFGGTASSLRRPFLDREGVFPVGVGAGGTDSRGIVIDPTPRIACKAKVAPADPLAGRTQVDVDRDIVRCARRPARAFIANRTPASLLVGEVGGSANDLDAYDPDRLILHTSIPLSNGPSKLYLAPVVEPDGAYGLRVFAVCFDSATVFVFDPETMTLENVIRVGLGPFAMAFDPFDLEDVALHRQVPMDPREAGTGLRRYRFAYVASFTNSFVQVIDLDNARANRATYERVVFTLGQPSAPKGT